jgi:hypothetical protein
VTESAGASSIDPRLGDPLSEVTRKERLYLLGASTIGVTIVFTGLVPSKIRAQGITFAQADRRSLLFILALVIAYFLVAFILYAASDFLAWITRFQAQTRDRMRRDLEEEMINSVIPDEITPDQQTQRMRLMIERRLDEESERLREMTGGVGVTWAVSWMPWPVSFLRGLFDFGLPILYGIFAIWILLRVEPPSAGGGASLEFILTHIA